MTACRRSPALFVDLNQAIASTAFNVHNVRSSFYTDIRAPQIVAEPAPNTKNMKVKIRTWNAVATWRWDLDEDDVCGICQVHFDGTCPTCKYPGDDCSLLSGKCGHNFHMHCIVEWIKQDSSKGQCPMCRQKFEWTDNTTAPEPVQPS
ncbi:hypothetical protein BTUL_0330g00020 [Botrytis tulipae]|uniref:Anaphase-promoting complex subunit 11 n=1 Tax=Botrytis tulipae TaxID=87230 RepID=A0A4Z1E4Q9_9HELO|nr:hypothetical protein BTUL_0330g00020 [Botrytis tulipae]